ncbi:hypothetical protein MLD38_027984 [Melastoma candidum]|uniref:Uncharacterized protein n=1 Tax=Melastoma candidum TaxID=119954 RepID=A0ACB9N068_9MYRT|nr:hypothetical protein MLD38_027984 [Melastoma candidum]
MCFNLGIKPHFRKRRGGRSRKEGGTEEDDKGLLGKEIERWMIEQQLREASGSSSSTSSSSHLPKHHQRNHHHNRSRCDSPPDVS